MLLVVVIARAFSQQSYSDLAKPLQFRKQTKQDAARNCGEWAAATHSFTDSLGIKSRDHISWITLHTTTSADFVAGKLVARIVFNSLIPVQIP